uniref:Uncharacterized protein n=1 Tax=Rhizophora mucronata TaxID=61149 RepID=A0A2P2M3U6_RHIMU
MTNWPSRGTICCPLYALETPGRWSLSTNDMYYTNQFYFLLNEYSSNKSIDNCHRYDAEPFKCGSSRNFEYSGRSRAFSAILPSP